MSKVVAFGELLWDLLPGGPQLGGAPFNFIYRISRLGHQGVMISALGIDPLGEEAEKAVRTLGLSTAFLQHKNDYPTGTVKVFFDADNQPDYEIIRNVAYDHISFEPDLEALASGVDCVCFGTLAQRERPSRTTFETFLDRAEQKGSPLKFLDINLRQNCYSRETVESSLRRADILKLNDQEASILSTMLGAGTGNLAHIAEQLVEAWSLQYCIVTMGERGALCVSRDGKAIYDPGYAVELVDPCGSGDAFAAGFLHKVLGGHGIVQGCQLGNILGAIVATQRGATGAIEKEQLEHFRRGRYARVVDPNYVSIILKQEANDLV